MGERAVKTYRVNATREGRYWVLEVEGASG
jgi:ribosomal protein S6